MQPSRVGPDVAAVVAQAQEQTRLFEALAIQIRTRHHRTAKGQRPPLHLRLTLRAVPPPCHNSCSSNSQHDALQLQLLCLARSIASIISFHAMPSTSILIMTSSTR